MSVRMIIDFLIKRPSQGKYVEPKNGESKIFLKWISPEEVELEITQYNHGRNVLGYLDTETVDKLLRVLKSYRV